MAVKDFENDHSAVHDVAADLVFEVARLRRRNVVIHQHESRAPGIGAGE